MKLALEVARGWRFSAVFASVTMFSTLQLAADDPGPFGPDIPAAAAGDDAGEDSSDLDGRIEITVNGGIRSQSRTDHSTSVTVRNVSDEEIEGPLGLVVDAAGLDELEVVEFDGKLSSGEPYVELLAGDATLRAGASLRPKRVQFTSQDVLSREARNGFAPEFRVVVLTDEDQAEDVADSEGDENLPGKNYSQADLDRVMEIQESWTSRLMQMAFGDVFGTAVAEDDQGNLVVRVYTSRPGIIRELPGRVDGIPLQQEVTGEFFRPGPTTSKVIYVDGKAVVPGRDGEDAKDPEPIPDPVPDETEPPAETDSPDESDPPGESTVEPGFTGTPGDPTVRFPRAVPIGVSSFNLDFGLCATGTLGCRLVDPLGAEFALSNNHVWGGYLAIISYRGGTHVAVVANPGDRVVQPGPLDTRPVPCAFEPLDQIGIVADYEPILLDLLANCVAGIAPPNFMDATIMQADPGAVDFCTPPDGYGHPQRHIVTPRIGMEVQKYGRTTVYTSGTITAVNGATCIPYTPTLFGYFIKQIEIYNLTPFGHPFSQGGDSGSLVVVSDPGGEDDRKPVALLFAGGARANGLDITIANPIGPVVARFGMTVDDGSGDPGTGGVSGTSGGVVGPLEPAPPLP